MDKSYLPTALAAELADIKARLMLDRYLMEWLFMHMFKDRPERFVEFIETAKRNLVERNRPADPMTTQYKEEALVLINVHLERFAQATLRRVDATQGDGAPPAS